MDENELRAARDAAWAAYQACQRADRENNEMFVSLETEDAAWKFIRAYRQWWELVGYREQA